MLIFNHDTPLYVIIYLIYEIEVIFQMTSEASQDLLQLQRENAALRAQVESLQHALNCDSFTSTYNKRYFIDRLEKICAANNSDFAVLFIDVDGLKFVNDQFGHAIGDEILLQTSDMLNAAIVENAILARIGGDEFGILVHDQNITQCVENIKNNIHPLYFQIATSRFEISVSIGIAYGRAGISAANILAEADNFMYANKNQKLADNDIGITGKILSRHTIKNVRQLDFKRLA